jgi:hypothetical protein
VIHLSNNVECYYTPVACIGILIENFCLVYIFHNSILRPEESQGEKIHPVNRLII